MGHVSRLELRPELTSSPNGTELKILVDGRDLGALVGRPTFIGNWAPEMLGEDSPLLPAVRPRRVALYSCSCSILGCGNVSAVVERRGRTVVWSDFRDVVGVFVRPLSDDGEESVADATLLRDEPLMFNARDYVAEVHRASEL